MTDNHQWVFDYYSDIKKTYIDNGLDEYANELVYMEDVPEEEIQKMREHTEYVGIWYTNYLKSIEQNES